MVGQFPGLPVKFSSLNVVRVNMSLMLVFATLARSLAS